MNFDWRIIWKYKDTSSQQNFDYKSFHSRSAKQNIFPIGRKNPCTVKYPSAKFIEQKVRVSRIFAVLPAVCISEGVSETVWNHKRHSFSQKSVYNTHNVSRSQKTSWLPLRYTIWILTPKIHLCVYFNCDFTVSLSFSNNNGSGLNPF